MEEERCVKAVNERAGYERWKERVFIWLIWLLIARFRYPVRIIGKDVARMIARMVPVDLSGVVS